MFAIAIETRAEAAATASAQSIQELRSLSLEELANLEITSVSRRPESLSRAAAAVYVITGEEIRRSGAVSLAEALRLAPNLQVARLNGTSYAISARGFNSFEAANKLLVLADGRSIYSPLHAGVFWDQQQVPLSTIERIEVISGPGGTLWGANAVNGVINVITKSAMATQGALVDAKVGTVDHQGLARHGGRISDNVAYRFYGLGTNFGAAGTPGGGYRRDEWRNRQGGFRSDARFGDNAFTLQGDFFDNDIQDDSDVYGGNILGRWRRSFEEAGTLEVQAYYDNSSRLAKGLTDRVQIFDVQAQHSFTLGSAHAVVWGGGYRANHEKFDNRQNAFVLNPVTDTTTLASFFVQDSIRLHEDVTLTLGSKVEHNSFTGFEFLPNARVGWRVNDTNFLWAAVSRAVRMPTRLDTDLTAAGVLLPASDFRSEKLIAYEIGWRGQPSARSSLSLSLFYNQYDDLRVLTAPPGGGLPLMFGNRMHGDTYGMEAWGDYQVTEGWRLSAGLSTLHKDLRLESGAITAALDQHQGNDPGYQLFLRSSMTLGRVEFDLGLRAIDDLEAPAVPGYVAVDARLGIWIAEGVNLSIAGFNLFDARHPETGQPASRGEVRRSAYLGLRCLF